MGGWQGSTRQGRLPANWDQVRAFVLARDNGQCNLHYPGCWNIATDVDHINPGDNHDPSNLQAACGHCHSRKSAREGGTAAATRHGRRQRPPEKHPGLIGD